MSMPSAVLDLAEKLDRRDSHILYKNCVNPQNSVPRNLKQAQKIKYYVNKSKIIAFDEILNIHLISSELDWVKQISTLTDFFSVIYDKKMVDEVNNLKKNIVIHCRIEKSFGFR